MKSSFPLLASFNITILLLVCHCTPAPPSPPKSECSESNCPAPKHCLDNRCDCPQGQAACGVDGQVCTSLMDNAAHCGACGQTCKGACVNGICEATQPPVCQPLQPIACGDVCVNLQDNPTHCGSCNQPCLGATQCHNGTCQCPVGMTLCEGVCVIPSLDPNHCGGCGRPCQAGRLCADGKCVATCPPATPTACGASCASLQTNRFHCGKCQRQCPDDQLCVNSACVCPSKTNLCSSPDGKGSACIDAQTNWLHCGGCGNSCRRGQLCAAGKCVDSCPASQDSCFGGCFDLQSSPVHCGACGAHCDAESSCIKGICKKDHTPCPGQTLCGEACIDLQNHDAHCGACNNPCSNGQSCVKGQCTTTQCQPDTRLCGATCCPNTSNCCDARCVTSNTPELCNGIDDNCDGRVDESPTGDGDTCVLNDLKGPCRNGRQTCEKGKFVCKQIYAPMVEDCSNGIDDDCDGIPDGPPCSCTDGQSRLCYDGPAKTRSVGECKDGTQVCTAGSWGKCVGSITPTAELCDQLDNDCNGLVDDGDPGGGGTCNTGNKGICAAGRLGCVSGKIACIQLTQPTPEICDQKDNNCDGQVDEGNICGACVSGQTRSCYTGDTSTRGIGECKAGFETCTAGRWGNCVGQQTPTPEVCDGKDNNCDGKIDEGGICSCPQGATRQCYTGPNNTVTVGDCVFGSQACNLGVWGSCKGETTPISEECDGRDNDCDGQVDEKWPQLGQPCTVGIGECQRTGTNVCRNTFSFHCNAVAAPATPEVCDGKDNNCDGQVDESDPQLGNTCYISDGNQCLQSTFLCIAAAIRCPYSAQLMAASCTTNADCVNCPSGTRTCTSMKCGKP